MWGGDDSHEHSFEDLGKRTKGGIGQNKGLANRAASLAAIDGAQIVQLGSTCPCGAWLGNLGLEPDPGMYIAHLVECFREVWRVLRDDATLWLNMGDSYAGSGNGAHDYRDRATSKSLSLNPEKYQGQKPLQRVGPQEHTEGHGRVQGYKPKDLMLMPFRVAMALQQDGWWLRSVIPWVKRAAMPESVTDRPSTAVEYVFLLAKSSKYFWDADAVRANGAGRTDLGNMTKHGDKARLNHGGVWSHTEKESNGRNRRNSDWFFESWQGLLLDERDGAPLALVVNPAGFAGAHFATFAPKLVEPMIKASTSEKGQCPECGAPWVRTTEPTPAYREKLLHANDRGDWYDRVDTVAKRTDGTKQGKQERGVSAEYKTTGWRPTCAHDGEPVPQTVLDPFGGSGTVGLVADRLGRNAILCELSESYSSMGVDRITGDSPLFTDVGLTA